MSHFPSIRSNDHISLHLKAETRETNSAEVWVEIAEKRQVFEERTARLSVRTHNGGADGSGVIHGSHGRGRWISSG